MSIPPQFLEQLRSRLTLSDVIGKRIQVMRAGREFKACCPFHKEKTPSFTINDDKQFYHCFGCGAHGDVIKFVMEHDNLPFMDALESLAAQAGLSVPKLSQEDAKKAKQQKDLYTLMDEACSWLQDQLLAPGNQDVRDYLKKRGLNKEIVSRYRLGFAPNDAQGLRSFLKEKGYTDTQMISAALVKEGKSGRDPYVFFRDRVMVPVLDRRGRVVAFGGRILPDHMRPPDRSDFTPAKYMNSAETPIFNKGEVLYGEPQARQASANGQTVLVTEGYFDVIACHKAGFEGAVAPMGTALTEEQILKLWQMIPEAVKEPVLCFDGDNAGRRAAERAAERILPMLAPGQSARFAFLPDGEDPDSLIQASGRSGFQKILQGAIPMAEFLWQSHTVGRNFETPESRASLVKTMNEAVQKIADREVQRHYDQFMRDKVSQNFYARKQSQYSKNYNPKFTKSTGNRAGGSSVKIARPARRSDDLLFRILIAAVINHPYIFDGIDEELGTLKIQNENYTKIVQVIINTLNDDPRLDTDGICSQIKARGLGKELDHILSQATYMHARFAAPGDEEVHGLDQKWLDILDKNREKDLAYEIKQGWKQAFKESSEEDEEKMKTLIYQQSSQGS